MLFADYAEVYAVLMNTPTLPAFKHWAHEVQPAARAVLMARVHVEMEHERVNAYVRPIFDDYKFTYGATAHDRTGPIPDPEHLYLCDDEPMLAAFYADCDKAHRAHGFTGPAGHCPALRADMLRVITENALIDLAEPLFHIDHTQLYGENRAKYLDLLIGASLLKSTDSSTEGVHP
jgi:hypothetical protein